MTAPKDILAKALDLPEEARARLALRLLESLQPPPPRSDDAWVEEIQRRAELAWASDSDTSSWDEVRARAEAALRKNP